MLEKRVYQYTQPYSTYSKKVTTLGKGIDDGAMLSTFNQFDKTRGLTSKFISRCRQFSGNKATKVALSIRLVVHDVEGIDKVVGSSDDK